MPSVLLIEDDRMNRKLMCDILQICFDVLEADSAEQAQQILEIQYPALILLDLQLPGMDGLDFLEMLQADPSVASIPVVILSAHAFPDQVEKGLRRGCVEYLTKPLLEDPNDFAHRMAQLAQNGQHSSKAHPQHEPGSHQCKTSHLVNPFTGARVPGVALKRTVHRPTQMIV